MKFTQGIKMALSSVVANKMRSFLTMLGITGSRETTVSKEEIATLKTKPGIKNTTSVEATTPNYEEIKQIGVESGWLINQNDVDNRYRVAVVGVDVIDAVFPNRNVVGQTILVNGNEFTIIGVLQSKGSNSAGSNDNKIIIHITTAQRLLKNKSIRTFYVETTSPDTVNDAMASLQVFMLRKSNNDNNLFRVFNQSDLLSTATASSDSMTLMLVGIADIFLLVGGIGIMNIMIVSVIERTGGIGLRKAVGAKRGDILL